MAGLIYFAIGDVHGESRKLAELHAAILERIAFEGAPARIIHLGDYVDRGPDTRGVIERVMALEARFASDPSISVKSLKGNHEQMMLDAYDRTADAGSWWSQGGAEAADSYAGGSGLAGQDWRQTIPADHISWMRGLESIAFDRERAIAFVHAGIEPASFPDCADAVRLWTRSDRFFDHANWPEREELKNLLVVHGHTPRSYQPENFPHRINVDTGACFGGPLTAVMLKEGAEPQFLRGS
jgi:serine/threonine protein phosphatase 1